MKNKYSIVFFIFTMTSLFVLFCAYQSSYQHSRLEFLKKQEMQAVEKRQEIKNRQQAEQNKSITTGAEAKREEGFYLIEENGYIVVYLPDQITPYEYTDILYDELPINIRQKIRKGLYIKDSEELYGFLENYTS